MSEEELAEFMQTEFRKWWNGQQNVPPAGPWETQSEDTKDKYRHVARAILARGLEKQPK